VKYKLRKNPLFSACGLNCGLCPRYYTDGPSKCPGCAGEGFTDTHCGCGILSCCQRKELEYCFLCSEFPCLKYDGADLKDSFISHKNQFHDMNKAKQIGIESYEIELSKKVEILKELLKNYNDGRKKNLFCIAVNLLELSDVESIISRIAIETKHSCTIKEKAIIAARLFQDMADKKNISFKLRK